MKVAVSGFRHGHINAIIRTLKSRPDLEFVAAAEEQPEACADILKLSEVPLTHGSLDAMLKDVDFDILVVGDFFAKRGAQAIRALEAGKHVLVDKPLCTRMEEIQRIRSLAESKGLCVMTALTLRYIRVFNVARQMLLGGEIGEIATCAVFGDHPLSYKGGRPDWYFEPGAQGGTLNDLLIHGVDMLGWITGHSVAEVIAARAWHVEPADAPHFQDAAQAFLRLENGAGVIADCSYKTPKGHSSPWVFNLWGTRGRMTVSANGQILLCRPGEPRREIQEGGAVDSTLADDFVAQIRGDTAHRLILSSEACLDSTERALRIQAAADKGQTNVLL